MAEGFTPINTQEEFNQRIQDRVARERATVTKEIEEKYADYNQIKKDRDDFSSQIEGFQKTAEENAEKMKDLETKLEEANKKAAGFELDNLRTQVALEKGLPMELRGRLSGKTKEELEQDAEGLAKLFKKKNNENIPPFEQHENNPEDKKKAAMMKLAKGIKKGE